MLRSDEHQSRRDPVQRLCGAKTPGLLQNPGADVAPVHVWILVAGRAQLEIARSFGGCGHDMMWTKAVVRNDASIVSVLVTTRAGVYTGSV